MGGGKNKKEFEDNNKTLSIKEAVNMLNKVYNNEYVEIYDRNEFLLNINYIINEKCHHVEKIIHSDNPVSINGI